MTSQVIAAPEVASHADATPILERHHARALPVSAFHCSRRRGRNPAGLRSRPWTGFARRIDACARTVAGRRIDRAVRQSMWTDPAKPPAIDVGEATLTPVLGGRHLRQDLRIDSPTGAFRGLGYLGYDLATRRYDSLWMDVNFTGMILAHGSYDPSRRTYELTGAMPDPHHAGATLPLREVMRVPDADHFTYEYYEHHDGREMLAVRLEYTRR